MKYIQCKNCNHFNPIKSEYQIFCDSCGKKLPNNFKAWLQKFPNKNFEDYKTIIGIEKVAPKKERKKISLKKVLQIVFIIVFTCIGSYFGKQQGSKLYLFFQELAHPISELLDKEWNRQYFIDKQISFESPYLLKKDEALVKLPEELKDIVLNMDSYIYKGNPIFSIALNNTIYDESIGAVSLKGASDGSVTEMMQEMNGSDLFYSDSDTYINQYPVILKKGNFKSDGNDIYFKSLVSNKTNTDLICFICVWIGKNDDFELLADRIIDSFDIR